MIAGRFASYHTLEFLKLVMQLFNDFFIIFKWYVLITHFVLILNIFNVYRLYYFRLDCLLQSLDLGKRMALIVFFILHFAIWAKDVLSLADEADIVHASVFFLAF